MPEKKDIGRRLREFANNNFTSIAELAKELGMQRQQLYGYFGGDSYPGGEILIKLGKLGCDLNWLLLGEPKYIVKEATLKYDVNETLEQKLIDHFLESYNSLQEENKKLKKQIGVDDDAG